MVWAVSNTADSYEASWHFEEAKVAYILTSMRFVWQTYSFMPLPTAVNFPTSFLYINNPRLQSSWGQHGAHLGPVGPGCAPCWPHKPCYQGQPCKSWPNVGPNNDQLTPNYLIRMQTHEYQTQHDSCQWVWVPAGIPITMLVEILCASPSFKHNNAWPLFVRSLRNSTWVCMSKWICLK